MDVKKATPHTKFNAAKLQADISVLELTGSLPTDKINCKIIALPQSDLKPTEGLELTFSGWDTNPEGDPPFLDNLQDGNALQLKKIFVQQVEIVVVQQQI